MVRRIFILISAALIIFPSVALAERLMIADFDRGEKPNLIGGEFGAWNKSKTDTTQFARESFNSKKDVVYGGKGCSLQLDYDVNSPADSAYNGFWMRLRKIDLTKYDEFIFYVKGDADFGYTKNIKVELKSMAGDIAKFNISGITDKWQKVVLPLYKIKQDGNFSEGYEFTIIFEDATATDKEGRIYIDQIYVQ